MSDNIVAIIASIVCILEAIVIIVQTIKDKLTTKGDDENVNNTTIVENDETN